MATNVWINEITCVRVFWSDKALSLIIACITRIWWNIPYYMTVFCCSSIHLSPAPSGQSEWVLNSCWWWSLRPGSLYWVSMPKKGLNSFVDIVSLFSAFLFLVFFFLFLLLFLSHFYSFCPLLIFLFHCLPVSLHFQTTPPLFVFLCLLLLLFVWSFLKLSPVAGLHGVDLSPSALAVSRKVT